MIGRYRIYPSWFAMADAGARGPMDELAHGSAKRMGCEVVAIQIVGRGQDFRGDYVDFNVAYSSTGESNERTNPAHQ